MRIWRNFSDRALSDGAGEPGGACRSCCATGTIRRTTGWDRGWVTHQTVQRCLARASRFGVMAALDDSPRPGKEPEDTLEAQAWLVSLACQKAKDVGYPHELWTTRLLARHARDHAPSAGHVWLARIAQGTVCKILAEQEVKPHKVRYYLGATRAFEAKMAEVLCVYQEVAILRAVEADAAKACPGPDRGGDDKTEPNVAFISYDEKPGIQAISNTAPDLPPVAKEHPCVARDHEDKRWSLPLRGRGIQFADGQSTCSPDKFTLPWKIAIARASSSVSSRSSMPLILPTRQSRSSSTIIRRMCPRRPTIGSPISVMAASASHTPKPGVVLAHNPGHRFDWPRPGAISTSFASGLSERPRPRVRCDKCGVKTVSVPWARPQRLHITVRGVDHDHGLGQSKRWPGLWASTTPGFGVWEGEAAVTLSGEPFVGFLGHMRRMIVEDDLDRRVGRISCIELLEEANKFARAVAVFDAGMNFSGEQVDPCQQAQCPVALLFMVACDTRMLARYRRQVRSSVGDRLDARLLVIGDERDVWFGLVSRLPIKSGAGLGRVSFRGPHDGNLLINT